MPEEVLFETESRMARSEVASYLRTVADRLDATGDVTLAQADETVTLSVPDRPTFEVKVERETSSSGGVPELSVEFELEWREGESAGGSSGDLRIE